MLCEIFKGSRKPDTYLYMQAPADFERLPQNIRELFGELQRVMELEITGATKLAKEQPDQVLENIEEFGFHIQLPPKDHVPDIL